MADGTSSTTRRPACAAGCGQERREDAEVCSGCLNEYVFSPEYRRAKEADFERADQAFFDFVTRRSLERRNG